MARGGGGDLLLGSVAETLPVESPVRHALMDRWPGAVALLDAEGTVLWANVAWLTTNLVPVRLDVGASYTAACRSAADAGAAGAEATLRGFTRVVDGEAPHFRSVYPCPQEDGRQRWCQVTIWPVDQAGFSGVGVAHEDVTEIHEAERRAAALADTDPLTGLANRRALERVLSTLSRSGCHDHQFGVFALLDLDRFKAVNDCYGHDVGDRVLAIIARRLRHNVRQGDTVARIGGDEFALLLAGGLEAAQRLGALAEAIKAPIQIAAHHIEIDFSYGWVPIVGRNWKASALYRAADQAMYRMKATHRTSTRAGYMG